MWPAKTRIKLSIRPVWSESLLHTWRRLGSLATHTVHSKDTDQTGQDAQADLSLRWVHSHFAGFVVLQLNYEVEITWGCRTDCISWYIWNHHLLAPCLHLVTSVSKALDQQLQKNNGENNLNRHSLNEQNRCQWFVKLCYNFANIYR